jgi:hypothetical protein
MGKIFNDLVASGEVSAPIVIGRDHLDCGSVASPNRETEQMKDGSDAIADWPILNALLNSAGGASWVSVHHGGRRHRLLAPRGPGHRGRRDGGGTEARVGADRRSLRDIFATSTPASGRSRSRRSEASDSECSSSGTSRSCSETGARPDDPSH